MVHLTLYVHDCAVGVHTVIESSVLQLCQTSVPDGQREEQLRGQVLEKMDERSLWLQETQVEAQVSAGSIRMRLYGEGGWFPKVRLEQEQTLHRESPCQILRYRYRMKRGEK